MTRPQISIAEFITRLPAAKIEGEFMREESVVYDDYTGAPWKIIWGFIYNRLIMTGMSICYGYAYEHSPGKAPEIDFEDARDVWQIEYTLFDVVDADGGILSANQIGEIIIEERCEIIAIDWSLLEKAEAAVVG